MPEISVVLNFENGIDEIARGLRTILGSKETKRSWDDRRVSLYRSSFFSLSIFVLQLHRAPRSISFNLFWACHDVVLKFSRGSLSIVEEIV